jgi:ParB-like chromosome segregation protein Spo0J
MDAREDLRVLLDAIEVPEVRLREFDPRSVEDLAESINEAGGLLESIGVRRKAGEAGRYVLMYGARRVMAYRLLLGISVAGLKDPNRDPEAARYRAIPAHVYPEDTSNEVSEALEIMENLHRLELTANEKTEHTVKFGAFMQRRLKHELKVQKRDDKNIPEVREKSPTPRKGRGRPPKPVAQAVADALGINRNTLDSRVKAASKAVGRPLDLDKTPPEELERAAREIRDKASQKKARAEAEPVPAVVDKPQRRAAMARVAETWEPIMATIRRAYDDLPMSHHGLFVTMAWKDIGRLKSEAEAEVTRARKAEHAAAGGGEVLAQIHSG